MLSLRTGCKSLPSRMAAVLLCACLVGAGTPYAAYAEAGLETIPFGTGPVAYDEETVQAFGTLPDPVPAPSIHDGEEEPSGVVDIPSSYSIFDNGRVTSVKDQESYGTCWAFAATATVEASLLSAGIANDPAEVDLSERHLANFTFHNQPDALGYTAGDYSRAKKAPFADGDAVPNDPYLWAGSSLPSAYRTLTNWMGPVDEFAAPRYEDLNHDLWRIVGYGHGITRYNVPAYDRFVQETLVDPALARSINEVHVTGVSKIPLADRDDVKQAIMNHGAVSVRFDFDTSYNSWRGEWYNTYQPAMTDNSFGHAVTLVGWDDNYSADEFKETPSEDGAWIAKNSYGSYWANDGFFMLSYDHFSLKEEGAAAYCVDVEAANRLDNNYQHDGAVGTNLNKVNSGGSIASVFKAKANAGGFENLKAVGLWLSDARVQCNVEIYTNLKDAGNPESGTLQRAATTTWTTDYAGYTTIPLAKPVKLVEGTTFSVVVTLTKRGSDTVRYDIDTTYGPGTGAYESSTSTQFGSSVAPNQSFERDSAGAAWDDLSSASYDVDQKDDPYSCARLKAFTCNVGGTGEPVAEGRTWVRLSGKNALATMASIVQADRVFTPSNTSTVVVASADGYKDALSATALAGLYRAPVLITPKGSLGDATKTELQRLKPSTVLVAGGPAAVSDATFNAIRSAAKGAKVQRVFGSNAVGTSVALYQQGANADRPWGDTAIVATSDGYKDALSIAPYAYAEHAPIFLASPNKDSSKRTLATNVVDALKKGKFKRVIIVGGTSAVSSQVEGQLSQIGVTGKRIAGQNALKTSAAIAQFELSEGMDLAHMAVATTSSYKDALTGAALAGAQRSVLVLANPTNGYDAFDAAYVWSQVAHGHVLGGPVAISDASLNYFRAKK